MDHFTDGVAWVNDKGILEYINPSFSQHFGIIQEQALSTHWQKVFSEQSIGIACHEQQRMIETGKASFEAMAKNSDKELFPILVTLIKGTRRKGKHSGFYFYTKDLTEQKEAQREATQKHKELRQLFDNLPIIVFYKDNADNIVRTNKLASDLLGKDVSEVEGKSALDIFPEKYQDYFKDDIAVLRSRTPKHGIVEEFYHPDGQKSWIKTDKIPFKDPVNSEDRILSISQDITMMKLAEIKQEKLIHDLKNTNKELERFAYICSHDLQGAYALGSKL